MELTPIGRVRSSRSEPFDDGWDSVSSTIELDVSRFAEASLAGLDQFSHIEVLYLFHLVEPSDVETGARHPRDDTAWPEVGIFAQRARNRPNPIGLTTCRLLAVLGRELTVSGLDAIDGTPVLDLKPYMTEFGPRGPVHQPAWSHELMARYWDQP